MLRPISRATVEWPFFTVALAGAGLPTEDLDGSGQKFFALEDNLAFGGFAHADRKMAPAMIALTPQSKRLCPGSAVFMCRPAAAATT